MYRNHSFRWPRAPALIWSISLIVRHKDRTMADASGPMVFWQPPSEQEFVSTSRQMMKDWREHVYNQGIGQTRADATKQRGLLYRVNCAEPERIDRQVATITYLFIPCEALERTFQGNTPVCMGKTIEFYHATRDRVIAPFARLD